MPEHRPSPGSPASLFAAVGFGLVAAHAVLIHATNGLDHGAATSVAALAPLIALLALPACALLVAGPWLVRVETTSRRLALLVACGLLMRLAWLGTTPPLEDDYNRYLWDGAVVAHGLDPYAVAPKQVRDGSAPVAYAPLALLPGAAQALSGINFPELRTIYPTTAQAAFALAHLVAPFKVDGLRWMFLCAEAATLVLLLALLREVGRAPMWAALYWWSPLPAAMLIGLAHVDALIPPLVLGAILAMTRSRRGLAAMLIGLAAGVKIWPLLLAPMVLWPLVRDPRRLLAAAAALGVVLAVATGPVLVSTLSPGSGLSAFAAGWSNNNAFYAWVVFALQGMTGSWGGAAAIVRAVVALLAGAIAIVMAVRGDQAPGSISLRALVVAASIFYLSPAQFPWYAVWYLPLAAIGGSWPLLLASATLPFYYLFFPLWQTGRQAEFLYGAAFIHSVPVLLWLVYDWTRAGGGAAARAWHDAGSSTPDDDAPDR